MIWIWYVFSKEYCSAVFSDVDFVFRFVLVYTDRVVTWLIRGDFCPCLIMSLMTGLLVRRGLVGSHTADRGLW